MAWKISVTTLLETVSRLGLGRASLVAKLKKKDLILFPHAILFFEAFGVRETQVFEGVEMPLSHFINTLPLV